MTKAITAGVNLVDIEAAKEILQLFEAPVTARNVENLKIVVTELGEMFEESYNKMLIEIANEKLAMYNCKCECGRSLTVDVTKESLFGGGVKV